MKPFPVALLNELIDDYGAAAEIVNAQARDWADYIKRWQPRPCPPRYVHHPKSSLPSNGTVGSSGEQRDGSDPVVHPQQRSTVTLPTRGPVLDPARWDTALLPLVSSSHRVVDTALLGLTVPAVVIVAVQLARGFS